MSSSKLAAVLIGTAVTAGTAVLVYLATRPVASTAKPAAGAKATPAEAAEAAVATLSADGSPPLEKNTVVVILSEITQEMQKVLMQLAQIEEQLRTTARDRRQQISDEQMQEYLVTNFMNRMQQVEQETYTKHNVTEAAVQATATFYEKDAEVIAVTEAFKRLFMALTGPQVTQPAPEHMTMEKTFNVIQSTMEEMNEAMTVLLSELTEAGLAKGTAEFNSVLQERYVAVVDGIRKKTVDANGLTQEELTASVMKYKDDPEFQVKMQQVTVQQERHFAALGIQSAGPGR